MKILLISTIIALLLLLQVSSSSTPVAFIFAAVFSEPAKAGMFCDHDKISGAFLNNKHTVAHTIDSGNTEKPFNMNHHWIDIECSNADGSANPTENCGKCNAAGGSMKTFAVFGESANCLPEDQLTPKKKTYITELLNEAAQIMKEVVVAPDYTGGLQPNPATGTRCGINNAQGAGLIMPDAHVTPLPGVHFMVYVTAGPPSATLIQNRSRSDAANEKYGEPLAWGATCVYTTQTLDERPVAGHLHFAPRAIDADPDLTTSASKKKKDLYFVLHQMMHLLGWSNPMFRNGHTTNYLSSSKSTYTPGFVSSKTFAPETRSYIDTTTVRTEARTHFSCNFLGGAEYGERQDDSHLMKRVYADDFMSEPLPWDPVPYLSRMSFGFLVDTGFFKVNFNYIDANFNQSSFGKGKGCNFVRDRDCRFPKDEDYDEYCWNERDEQCNVDLSYGGPCNIVSYTGCVPSSRVSYFDRDCRIGGPEINDYCPTPARINSYGQCNDISNNKDSQGAYRLGSSYSNTSRCVQGTMIRVGETRRSPFLETRCVELVCGTDRTATPNNRSLFMKLINDSITVKCPQEGGSIDVGLYSADFSGSLVCPKFTEAFCTDNGLIEIGDVNALSPTVVDASIYSGASACSARKSCAESVYGNFTSGTSGDSCSDLSRAIQNCFLDQCDAEKAEFLRTSLGSNCTGAVFPSVVETYCSDGLDGAADLCRVVLESGAEKMSVVAMSCFMTIVSLVLFML